MKTNKKYKEQIEIAEKNDQKIKIKSQPLLAKTSPNTQKQIDIVKESLSEYFQYVAKRERCERKIRRILPFLLISFSFLLIWYRLMYWPCYETIKNPSKRMIEWQQFICTFFYFVILTSINTLYLCARLKRSIILEDIWEKNPSFFQYSRVLILSYMVYIIGFFPLDFEWFALHSIFVLPMFLIRWRNFPLIRWLFQFYVFMHFFLISTFY